MARISDHEIIYVISKSLFLTQKVLVGGQTSESTTVLSEVATTTGKCSGTTIFLIYINDLPRSMKSIVRMYANDTLVYNGIIQQYKWANVWQIQFNSLKCEFSASLV